jgi:hypothetical protein
MSIWEKDFGMPSAFGDEFLLSQKIDPPVIPDDCPAAVIYMLTKDFVTREDGKADLTNIEINQNPDGQWVITGESHFHLEEYSKESMAWDQMVAYIKKAILQYMISLLGTCRPP